MDFFSHTRRFTGTLLPLFLWLASCSPGEERSAYYLPAEFEPVASTCFVWSTDYYEIIPRLVGIISRKDPVTIFLNEGAEERESIRAILQDHGADPGKIRFVRMEVPLDNIWIRDYGPLYLVNRMGDKRLVLFRYFWTDPGFIDEFSNLTGIPVVRSEFNSTGGSREVNGKGTMILCEAHELEVNRPRSRDEIEKEMIERLGLRKVIWLKKGIPQDDIFLSGPLYDSIYPKGVHGHVDEFCRFADPGTILISSVSEQEAGRDPILAEAKRRLDENYAILVNATDQDGNRFNVIRVPIAPVIIHDRRQGPEGKIIASVTSYMNFIMTNSLVILPSYVSDHSRNRALIEKENQVETIFCRVFPEREIIRVRADTINYYSGGFHCASIQEPLVSDE